MSITDCTVAIVTPVGWVRNHKPNDLSVLAETHNIGNFALKPEIADFRPVKEQ